MLQIDEIDRPNPGPDEVLVAVRAASINPTDAKRRQRGRARPRRRGVPFDHSPTRVSVVRAGLAYEWVWWYVPSGSE